MFDFIRASSQARRLITQMPVADIAGTTSGATLLVTAGLDGDEHPPIEAAYRIAEQYNNGDFCGRLIVLPVVNVPGFEAGISQNPIDGNYPKYSIPGHRFGSPTSRLMHHIYRMYAQHATLWLDLHSASTGEVIIPFVWNDITGVQEVDVVGGMFCRLSGATAAVRQRASRNIQKLAANGCTYVLAESEDVSQHQDYISRAMQQLGMIPPRPSFVHPPRMFTKTISITTENKHKAAPMEDGLVLWRKMHATGAPGERLGEIAYGEITE